MLTLQNNEKGKLYTSNPNGIKNFNLPAEFWQITRAGVIIPNTILVKSLAPSQELFNKFIKEWQHRPSEEWWPLYKKQFIDELSSEEKLKFLRQIYRNLMNGINIVLICFCKDYNYCHRKLVGEFFNQYGIEAKELNPVKSANINKNEMKQLSMFME